MATLAENIKRGNDAITASRPDPVDEPTAAMDTIVHVMHAGYSNSLAEAAERIAGDQTADVGDSFVHPELRSAETFWDDVMERARMHFLAEQAGEDS